jgi:hypothetical protein
MKSHSQDKRSSGSQETLLTGTETIISGTETMTALAGIILKI